MTCGLSTVKCDIIGESRVVVGVFDCCSTHTPQRRRVRPPKLQASIYCYIVSKYIAGCGRLCHLYRYLAECAFRVHILQENARGVPGAFTTAATRIYKILQIISRRTCPIFHSGTADVSISSLIPRPETAFDKSWQIRTLDAETATVIGDTRTPSIIVAASRGKTNARPINSSRIWSKISSEKWLTDVLFPYATAAGISPFLPLPQALLH